MYKDKILLVTGGTGSFGNAIVERFLKEDLVKEIRVFSRDEKKQDDMRKKFQSNKLKFFIGDVRDLDSLHNCVKGSNFIFHAAALKQVPSCEFFPLEAVKTNVLGASNVMKLAINYEVDKCIVLSTDKAVYPINAMGMTKALMEKTMVSNSYNSNKTVFCATRYGNVMASRGSVIPLFKDQIISDGNVTITNPNMTRFLMTLEESVDLVLHAFENGKNGDIFVQKSPAATIKNLASAIFKLLKVEESISLIGTRHGEKLFETLVSKEEMLKAIDLENYYCIPSDKRSLNYEKYFSDGQIDLDNIEEYNSHNTKILSVDETIIQLKKLNLFDEI